ncbi:MAG: hypothetical protein IPI41_12200 [Flavobacteriales bacterium]|nr:hypothetical protein [Flavobacteriales bacterium]
MSRTFLSLLLLTTTLIAFGQKPKKVTTYTPVTGVNMEEVFPVAAYMVKHYYKGDMDYLAWGDRHMRSLLHRLLLGPGHPVPRQSELPRG